MVFLGLIELNDIGNKSSQPLGAFIDFQASQCSVSASADQIKTHPDDCEKPDVVNGPFVCFFPLNIKETTSNWLLRLMSLSACVLKIQSFSLSDLGKYVTLGWFLSCTRTVIACHRSLLICH